MVVKRILKHLYIHATLSILYITEQKLPSGDLMTKRDIESIEDITLFLTSFYAQLTVDERVHHIFEPINMDEHIVQIAKFWAGLILQQPGFQGNPMAKHFPLGLTAEHFEVWLHYFRLNIRKHFEGPKTEGAIMDAEAIGGNFKRRLGL